MINPATAGFVLFSKDLREEVVELGGVGLDAGGDVGIIG